MSDYELLISIKKIITNESLTKLELRALYIKYLELSVRLDSLKPNFKKDKHLLDGNCYTYSLGLTYPEEFKRAFKKLGVSKFSFNVGFISKYSAPLIKSSSDLINNFNADCEHLDIKVYESSLDSKNYTDGYKILMYLDEEKDIYGNLDYHFIRQNSNGTYSERPSYNARPMLLDTAPTKVVDGTYKLVRTVEIVKPVSR